VRPQIGGNLIQQTLTETINPVTFVTERKTTSNSVDLSSKIGWVIDFNPGATSPGERSTTDPTLDLGTLTFTTNVPSSSACTVGGKSYLYFLDYTTGGAVSSSVGGVSGILLGQALATRPVVIRLPSGRLISLTRLSSGATVSSSIPTAPVGSTGLRINWRELETN
jgi:type IV pilus assembly protein PilY1